MNNKVLNKTQLLILASKSPRRKYLLEQAGLSFTVIPGEVDEDSVPLCEPYEYVKTLAQIKANDIAEQYPDNWVLGADTIVLINDEILGKPGSKNQALKMLQKLNGKTHQVYTGFCLICKNKQRVISKTIITDVLFKKLSDHEIEWYINTPEPFDKAGAYAIQGIGTFLVKSISGSYTNVVGLPVCEVIETLLDENIIGQTIGKTGYCINNDEFIHKIKS